MSTEAERQGQAYMKLTGGTDLFRFRRPCRSLLGFAQALQLLAQMSSDRGRHLRALVLDVRLELGGTGGGDVLPGGAATALGGASSTSVVSRG